MNDADSTAARLCAACGLCCGGVLFDTVQLKPGDSAKTLASLGLKLKKKRGRQCMTQPCSAHRDCACSIYADRPTRCRLFECKQLKGLSAGEITEANALARIHEAGRLVAVLNGFLNGRGNTRRRRPLFKRLDGVFAEPTEDSGPESNADRAEALNARRELEMLLDREFRVEREIRA